MFLSSEMLEGIGDDHVVLLDPPHGNASDEAGADVERLLHRLALQRTGRRNIAVAFGPDELRGLRLFLALASRAQGRIIRSQRPGPIAALASDDASDRAPPSNPCGHDTVYAPGESA